MSRSRHRLSICCVTSAPPARVAIALAPYRALAAETVVIHDDRPDTTWAAAHGAVAVPAAHGTPGDGDAVLARCSGEWVLRIGAYEAPSAALLAALPTLIARTDVARYAIPSRWVFPDRDHWLDESPWQPDLRWTLTRVGHEGLGVAVDAPVYRLDPLLRSIAERRTDAIREEVFDPTAVGPDGRGVGVRHQPERFATRTPARIPAADRPYVRAALTRRTPLAMPRRAPAADPTPAPTPAAPHPAGPAACPAPAVLDHDLRAHAGRPRTLAVRVVNDGDGRWPAGGPVRLAARRRAPDGTLSDGPRTLLPVDLPAGAECLLTLPLDPIADVGPVTVEVGMVHEFVAWHPPIGALTLDVLPAAPLPLRRAAVHRRWRRRPAIPRILHRVWLGDRPMPDEHRLFGERWARHHPGWEHRLWTDESVPALPSAERARRLSERANVIRYELLRRFGGVYVDTDIDCLQPFDDLLDGVTAFAAYETPGTVCNALIGAHPHHPAFEEACRTAALTVGMGHYPTATGPGFLTRVLDAYPDVTLFGPEHFYPYLWYEERPPDGSYGPDCYAVHHWAQSWLEPSEIEAEHAPSIDAPDHRPHHRPT